MPMTLIELQKALRSLRLSGMSATLEARALQVAAHEYTGHWVGEAQPVDAVAKRHAEFRPLTAGRLRPEYPSVVPGHVADVGREELNGPKGERGGRVRLRQSRLKLYCVI